MEVVHADGASIPTIGFGTWQIRGAACSAAVAEALAAGYRHIDTAAVYGNEAEVREGMSRSGVARSEVFLATKVWPDHIGDGDLQRSAEASLGRLGTDYVDLLLIHWPSPTIPLAESIGALNDARRRGLTRHIGLSNFDADLLTEAVGLSDAPLVADQVEYHPRIDQGELLSVCRSHDVAFVSYSPLAHGGILKAPPVLDAARAHGRTPAQIVLRWNVQQGCVVLPKSITPERIRENLGIFDFVLTEEEMAALSALAGGPSNSFRWRG